MLVFPGRTARRGTRDKKTTARIKTRTDFVQRPAEVKFEKSLKYLKLGGGGMAIKPWFPPQREIWIGSGSHPKENLRIMGIMKDMMRLECGDMQGCENKIFHLRQPIRLLH